MADTPHGQPAGGADAEAPALDTETQPSAVASYNVSRRRAVVDILVQIVARAGNLVLGVLVTLIIVRALGSRGFGQWSTVLAIAQIATSFGDLGLTQVAVNNAARDPDGPADWLGALVGMRTLLSLPIFVIQLVLVVLLVPDRHVEVAGAIIALTTLLGGAGALTAAFQLRVRNDLTMLVLTVNSVLWTGGVALASAFTHDIRTFAVIFLISSIVSTLLTLVLALRMQDISLRRGRRLWRQIFTVGLALGGASILTTLYVRLDQILVFEYAGSRQAGLYAAAYRILDQIQFLPASVLTTLYPLIAAAYPGDMVRVRHLVQISAEYLAMGSLGVLAFTIVEARPIMVLLFGNGFAAAAPALPILMGAFVSISFGYLAGSMVAIVQIQRRFLVYTLICLALNAGLNVILIPRYGFQAAAWTTLATELTVMNSTMYSVFRKLEMRPQMWRLLKIAGVAAVMGVILWQLQAQFGATLWELVPIAAAEYVGLLLASGALSLADLRALRRE
jgi:O-antigen/teichoic acid export membrane protein